MNDAPSLNQSRRDAGLSMTDLWYRYFGLGGMSTPIELEAYVLGALQTTSYERNLVAHAINEHHVERGGGHPVPYVDDTA
jgi:hypothetical protein